MRAKRPYTSGLAKKAPRLGQGFYYDSLYGHIPITSEIRSLIDLEVFQRLREIKQLSTLYLVFPGAVHTRFEHSIGVAYLARMVHEHLRRTIRFSDDPEVRGIRLNEITLRAIEIAALLHDIGHGPFGHVFEMFCRRFPEHRHWSHESVGHGLITGQIPDGADDVGMLRDLFRQIPEYLEQLKLLLLAEACETEADKHTLDLLAPENIAILCFGPPDKRLEFTDESLSEKYEFLKQIIPSSFGVDRLDYLRRDAKFTGVKTGEIDISEIIGHLSVYHSEGAIRLFLLPAASSGMENLIRTRDAVYRHLYHNPTHRSAQELLIRALVASKEKPHSIALLRDNELLEEFSVSSNPFLREVAERFRFRILYEVRELGDYGSIKELNKYFVESWRNFNDFQGIEESLRGDLKMESSMHIFFDFERVPAIKGGDLYDNIFFDPVARKPMSLLEACPHLAELFGVHDILGRKVDRLESYLDSIGTVYVSFPYDYIGEDIDRISKEDAVEIDPISIKNVYNEKISQIVRTVIPSEGTEDGKDARRRLAAQFRYYLSDLVRIQKRL